MVDGRHIEPVTGEVCVGPGTVFRMMSFTSRTTASVRSRLEPGGRNDDDGLVADVLVRDEAGGHSRHLEGRESDQPDIEYTP